MDDYMSPVTIAEVRREDTEERWQDISDEKIDFFSDTLAFMDAAGFRFHMPRFMVYALTHPHGDSFAVDAPIYQCDFNEDSKEYALSRYALLSIEQCRTIRQFLWFAAEHDDYLDGRVALGALEKYWDRFE
jgi:hypothetical protein